MKNDHPKTRAGSSMLKQDPTSQERRPSFHKTAFTLAEVLITLGIIGVVAALSIPTLLQNAQATETVSKLKKLQSTLSSAYTLAINENGEPQTWGMPVTLAGSESMINNIAPYLQIIKKCGNDASCFPATYPMYGSTAIGIGTATRSTVQLSDGSLVRAAVTSTTCAFNVGTTNKLKACGIYNTDINGLKGPNRLGVDQFDFWLTKYGIIPLGTVNETFYDFTSDCKFNDSTNADNGYGCTAWVVLNGNMDYRKCNGLSWAGNKSCN